MTIDKFRNKILQGNAFDRIKEIPDNYVDMIITSPPYWGLRDYDTELVWFDEKQEKCSHNELMATEKGGRIKRPQDIDPKQSKHTYNHFTSKISTYRNEVHNDKSNLHNWSKDGKQRSNKEGKYAKLKDMESPLTKVIMEADIKQGEGLDEKIEEWHNTVQSYISKGTSGGIKSEKVKTKGEDNFQIVPQKQFAFCNICGAWYGQLGLEPDFKMYIKHLMQIFKECWRILKPEGSLWVNLGDTYSGSGTQDKWDSKESAHTPNKKHIKIDVKEKSLVGIPDRLKINMIDAGWTCRNEIIWHKPNAMPNSSKDRFTVDFEKLFFFTKQRKYYFETQLENVGELNRWGGNKIKDTLGTKHFNKANKPQKARTFGNKRIKRTVWKITTVGYSEGHFAIFPNELVKTPILATCPEKVCTKCGKAWKKKYDLVKVREVENYQGQAKKDYDKAMAQNPSDSKRRILESMQYEYQFLEWDKCNCDAKTQTGIAFDPFFGRGTVGKVANDLGRDFLGIDLNPEYIKLAIKYTEHSKRIMDFL